MSFLDILSGAKSLLELIGLGSIIDGVKWFKDLLDTRSKNVEVTINSLNEINAAMTGPDHDKVDIERLTALANYTRSVFPYAVIDYLYFVTKLATVFGFMLYGRRLIEKRGK